MYFDFAMEEKHSQQTTSSDLAGGRSMGSTRKAEKLQVPQTWIFYRRSQVSAQQWEGRVIAVWPRGSSTAAADWRTSAANSWILITRQRMASHCNVTAQREEGFWLLLRFPLRGADIVSQKAYWLRSCVGKRDVSSQAVGKLAQSHTSSLRLESVLAGLVVLLGFKAARVRLPGASAVNTL